MPVVETSYRVVAYNVFIERGNVAVVSHYLCIYRVDKKRVIIVDILAMLC